MKRCKKCGTVKPRSDFYRAPGIRDGLRSDCKSCNLAQQHARYVADPSAAKKRVKRWQQDNAARVNAYHRERRKDPRVQEAAWRGYLRRQYGITVGKYEEMLSEQGGVCAICRSAPKPGRRLHVDHDHETERIRGLLCFTCNNALGDFADDTGRLQTAIGYLLTSDGRSRAVQRRLDQLRAMRPAWERA